MKINAVNPGYVTSVSRRRVTDVQTPENAHRSQGMSVISFKGGNKDQVIMFGVEVPPYNKSGGVATVMQDFRALRISDSDPVVTNQMKNSYDFYYQKNKVLVDPFYNGFKTYDSNGIIKSIEVAKIPTGLADDNPFKKYEGRYFQTTSENFNKYATVEDFFKNFKEEKLGVASINGSGVKGNVFILDDVTGGAARKLDFGGLGDSETRLFRVLLEVDGSLRKTNDFKIFTDLTASVVTPYEKSGYSTVPGKLNQTWRGEADAKAAKAFIEFMPRICELASEDGIKFDPASLVLNDSQAGYASEYMGQQVAKGSDFWKGKKAIFIGHNLGDGYVQRTSYMNMFMNIADKELRNAVYHDEEFIDAAREGGEAVENYFKKLLPEECLDMQSQVSPFKNTVYYAQKGLVTKIIPVSELYAQSLATDPEFAPGIYHYAKELAEKGTWEGILNAFENVEFDPTSSQGPPGYYKNTYDINVNGKNVKIGPLSTYDAARIKEGAVDVKYVREIKRQNKLNILQRFDKDFLDSLKNLAETKGHEKDFNEIILGLGNKDAEVYGHIRKDIIEEAQKANSKVRMLAGWGRSDAQKAMDSVLRSFIDYAKNNTSDKYSVLFVGGPHGAESEKCINLVKQYASDPDIAGRIVFVDGFLPNKPFASAADFTVFPSRFAPCELTDLESAKMFSSPIVTNLQGLAQKNFDASFEGEAEKVTGYKTKHAYTIHLDEMKKLLSEEDNKALDKAVKKFREKIKSGVHGKEVTEEMIDKEILTNSKINYEYNFEVLRPFRDKIIEKELTECYRRALIEDNGKPVQDTMLQNLRKMKTEWENNCGLKKDGIASAQKYRKAFHDTEPSVIKEEDTLLYKLRKKCQKIIDNYKKNGGRRSGSGSGVWTRFTGWAKSKGGKWTLGIAAGTAIVAGAGYAGYKAGWLSPAYAEQKKEEHLSLVG